MTGNCTDNFPRTNADDQVTAALAAFGVPREVAADKARAPVPVALCGKDDLRVQNARVHNAGYAR